MILRGEVDEGACGHRRSRPPAGLRYHVEAITTIETRKQPVIRSDTSRAKVHFNMSLLSIGQVAERAGLATSAIRYYESQGLLPVAARHRGRRVYDTKVLERLALIDLVKNAGFTIAETRAMLNSFARKTAPGKRLRALASQKVAELDERIAEAERMKNLLALMMRCECPTFEDCSESLTKRRLLPLT